MAQAPSEPDPDQRRVLGHSLGALLVRGAAGTGKSTVLRERLAARLEAGDDPERIVLVVASRRARAAAQAALLARLGRSLPSLRITTIHGLAFQLVTDRSLARGDLEPPSVLDAAAQFALVRELLTREREHRDRWPAYGPLLDLRGFADELRQFVSRAQEALLAPERIAELAAERDLGGWPELARFYQRYVDELGRRRALDFAGLLRRAAEVAANGPPPLDEILVDDYQDATVATERLLLALAAPCTIVAGDPDAHVFSFQGTTVEPLRRFAATRGTNTVELRTNHRAPVAAVIEAWSAAHTSEEHRSIARELRRIHVEEGVAWSDLAVVVRRQGAGPKGLLHALDDAGVPRSAADGWRSLVLATAARPYILALRWLVATPEERDDLAETVLTSELGGLSPATARTLLRLARAEGRAPAGALRTEETLAPAERESLAGLREALEAADQKKASVQDAFRELWRRLPCSAALVRQAAESERARADLEGIVALAEATAEAAGAPDPSVEAFVRSLSSREGGPEGGLDGVAAGGRRDAVHVLTAHATAGMEFDTVVLAGAVEGDFPSLARPEPMFDLDVLSRPRTRSEVNRARIADERRLFQMVLARARRRVLLTASRAHGDESTESIRSRFVDQLSVPWTTVPTAPFPEPVSSAEAAAAWRRELADRSSDAPHRLAALAGLIALGRDPRSWWFQRDWSPGAARSTPPRLSYSRLDRLENCDLQFVLSEELGLDPGGGHQAWVGKLVHRIIEEAEDPENTRVERTPKSFAQAIEERWQPQRFPSYAISEAERRNALEVLVPNFFARYGALPPDPEGTERWFSFEMDGATITGKIDRIGPAPEGGRRITDFKTGRGDNAGPPQDSLQLGIYYLAVLACEDLQTFRPISGVELAFLGGTRGNKELKLLDWPIDPSEEAGYATRIRQRVADLVARVRSLAEEGRYVASTTASCFFCRFQTLCPRYAEGAPVFPLEEAPLTEAVT